MPLQNAPTLQRAACDRALLLLGFAGAFRRSELVALDVADIQEDEGGLRVLIRRSKTDQEGQHRRRASTLSEAKTFLRWLHSRLVGHNCPSLSRKPDRT
jgi:integrase